MTINRELGGEPRAHCISDMKVANVGAVVTERFLLRDPPRHKQGISRPASTLVRQMQARMDGFALDLEAG